MSEPEIVIYASDTIGEDRCSVCGKPREVNGEHNPEFGDILQILWHNYKFTYCAACVVKRAEQVAAKKAAEEKARG